MKLRRHFFQKVVTFVLLVMLCFVLGPELYIFAPEFWILLDVVGVEYFIGSAAILLVPMRDYLLLRSRMICKNENFRKYGMLIPFVVITPFMPELVVLMDVEILSTFLLINYGRGRFT